MYLVEFFKRNARKSNIPIFIYLGLNVVLITLVMMMFTTGIVGTVNNPVPIWILVSFLLAVVVYAISLSIALSSIGEAMLRKQTGCKMITDTAVSDFIRPIFNEVYAQARAVDPSISPDVELYMNDDPAPNAFATGRKTVCVTRGMLQMPVDQIKATLGHEFGHLSHKDTDLVLVVSVGNMIVDALILFIRIMIRISVGFMKFIAICMSIFGGRDGLISGLFTALAAKIGGWATDLFIAGFMWLWNKLGTFLVMKSSRDNEFLADEFSYNLGYGASLCDLLASFGSVPAKGLFQALASSHPDNNLRIDRIHQLMDGTIQSTMPVGITTSGNSGFAIVKGGNDAADNTSYAPTPVYTPDPEPTPAGAIAAAGGKFRKILTGAPAAAAMVDNTPAAQPEPVSPGTGIFCTNCHMELEADAKFCPCCGTPAPKPEAPKFCPQCGAKIINPAAKFCNSCGASLYQ